MIKVYTERIRRKRSKEKKKKKLMAKSIQALNTKVRCKSNAKR